MDYNNWSFRKGSVSTGRGEVQGQHIVKIDIGRNYIEGSVDFTDLSQSKSCNSNGNIYSESVPNGLVVNRYFPKNCHNNEVETRNQTNTLEKHPLRSFLIDETDTRVKISEMESLKDNGSDVKSSDKELSETNNKTEPETADSDSGMATTESNSTNTDTDIKDKAILTDVLNSDNEQPNGQGHVDADLDDEANKQYFADSDEEAKWLAWIETQFKKIAGDDGEISLDEFKAALGVKQSFFAERFFHLFDDDKSGSIECEELMQGLKKLTRGSPTEKLKFLFDVYDFDGSGTIDIDELKTVLRSCMEESSLKLSEEDLDNLTAVLFESADADNSGSITFEELKAELEKHPGVLENLTLSAAQWLRPPSNKKKEKGFTKYFTKKFILNNLRLVIFLFVYFLVNIGLGALAAYNYRTSNGFIIGARICGMNLNFNCMFVLVLMLRKSMTYMRMTRVGNLFPLDDHVTLHKLVGRMICFYSLVHTLCHIGNAIILSRTKDDLELWEILFTTKAGFGWVGGSAIITGWMLDIILIVIFICSMAFIRRGGHFQVFYWTHMLYIPFWILVIIHGSNFWKWFIVPGLIFIVETISKLKFIKKATYGRTVIEEVTLLPSGVTHLEISRPENFSYKPGDYIFIQIPTIAHYEWHPFTISSAPEMEGRIWLHVRSLGHWTKKLYDYFEQYDPGEVTEEDQGSINNAVLERRASIRKRRMSCIAQEEKQRSNSIATVEKHKAEMEAQRQVRIRSKHKIVNVKCFIDGPYGTATREIFNTEHAVLIGAGIGVTPMASILQSVMYNYKDSKVECPKCSSQFFTQMKQLAMKTRKVDFVWINRDQKAFEWFLSLLTNLEVEQSEEEDNKKIIDLHLYMTAAQTKTDMKGVGLQIALDLMHQKSNKDLITGLKTKTEPGRPNWNELLGKIAAQNKGKVHIFFCGSPQLGKIIKESADKYKMSFSKENF